MSETFLNGRVELHAGDSRDVLKTLASNSIDSIVTDPPYALVSIVKRFANSPRNERTENTENPYGRTGRGFMGQRWDTGETAFAVEFWAECLRVLKPGGHVVAFSGTRTYHRMACAIEDAGFEIRDQLQWLYGSGFPKSHDVSKGIDRAAGAQRLVMSEQFRADTGRNDNYGFGENFKVTAPATDSAIQWQGWGTALKPSAEPICFGRKPLSEKTVAANVLRWGTGAINVGACRVQPIASRDSRRDSNICTCSEPKADQKSRNADIRNPALSELSPAPQNAPLSNAGQCVTGHQLYANSQDGCPPYSHSDDEPALGAEESGRSSVRPPRDAHKSLDPCAKCGGILGHLSMPCDTIPNVDGIGRWPANCLHDGSDEVVAAFPETASGARNGVRNPDDSRVAYGSFGGGDSIQSFASDSGSAARFFYTSKADSDDRIGSKHPTVKPVDLMQWLVRLVTPPNGICLDPFAGTGTTAEACFREGMRCVLIEREPEYQADIRRRMALCMSGPDERKRESIKAKTKDQPADHGPLFSDPTPA